MKSQDLFKKIATQSGISEGETEKFLQSMAAVLNVEIPETVATQITADKFTLEAALNNPEILKKARAEALNGVDTTVNEIAKEYGFTDEDKSILDLEKGTSKKVAKAIKLIEAKEKAKINAVGKDHEKLTEEINKLNMKVAEQVESSKLKIQEIETARKQDKVNWNLDTIFAGKNYSTEDIIGKEMSILTAKQQFNKVLKDKGLTIETTEDGKLILKTSLGTDHFEGATKMEPEAFIAKVLTDSKLLKMNNMPNRGTETTRTYNQGEPSTTTKKNDAYDGFRQKTQDKLNFIPKEPTNNL